MCDNRYRYDFFYFLFPFSTFNCNFKTHVCLKTSPSLIIPFLAIVLNTNLFSNNGDIMVEEGTLSRMQLAQRAPSTTLYKIVIVISFLSLFVVWIVPLVFDSSFFDDIGASILVVTNPSLIALATALLGFAGLQAKKNK